MSLFHVSHSLLTLITVYTKNFAHSSCFVMSCCGLVQVDFTHMLQGNCTIYLKPHSVITLYRITSFAHLPALLYIDGLVQACSISIANALELLQSCTKSSIYHFNLHDTEVTYTCCWAVAKASQRRTAGWHWSRVPLALRFRRDGRRI